MVLVSSTDPLSPVKSSSGFSATSRDVPELLTRGLDSPDTLLKRQRRLGDEFFVYRIDNRRIPNPSLPQEGEWLVCP